MIYLFSRSEYDGRTTEAFEGPAGLDLSLMAFLQSLGLRLPPEYPQAKIDAAPPAMRLTLIEAWRADYHAWEDERTAFLKGNALYKQQEQAHLEWLQQHPDLTAIEFEPIF